MKLLPQELGSSIYNVNGYAQDAYTYIPVVIIGAGESGIAMGCRLKEVLGFDQFRIFERQSGAGGTWWINRYPGVACDIPAIFYSFSFCPNFSWTTFHPPGPEIVKYMHQVCATYGISDKIQCNTDVEQCRWLEDEKLWEVTLLHLHAGIGDLGSKDRAAKLEREGPSAIYSHKEIVRAKVVCSAVGGLVEPRGNPDVPGFETFEGETFHSARWDHNVDMTDKDVVVIGTGCSAAQFVPRLTKAPYNARSVTQIMRQPPWVVPRVEPPGGEFAWEKNSRKLLTTIPGLGRFLRALAFLLTESDWPMFRNDQRASKARAKTEARLLRHLYKTVPKKYHDMLTPKYPVGCKRRIFDASWFPGLNDTRIELTQQPLQRVNKRSVTIGPSANGTAEKTQKPLQDAKTSRVLEAHGSANPIDDPPREIPADVIVRANGFDVTTYLTPLKVVGRDGKDMVDVMEERGGPQAYQGTALDGYPNFFLIFGPNTATGHSSVIFATENMVAYSLNFIKLVLAGEAETVEVKKQAEIDYAQDLQRALRRTVWHIGGCNTWYYRGDGWNSTVYPYSQWHFTYRSFVPYWSHWNIDYTPRGRRLLWMRRALRLAFTAAVVYGISEFWRARALHGGVFGALRAGLAGLGGILEKVARRVSQVAGKA